MPGRKSISKYLSRWKAVEAVQLEEMRQMTIDQRWRQLKALSNRAWGLGLNVEKKTKKRIWKSS